MSPYKEQSNWKNKFSEIIVPFIFRTISLPMFSSITCPEIIVSLLKG